MAGKIRSVENGVTTTLKKAYSVENGTSVKLKKAYSVENGITQLLWNGSRGVSEFLKLKNSAYEWVITDDGNSIRSLINHEGDLGAVCVRNNILYRMLKTIDSNGYTISTLQKKSFESSSWVNIRASLKLEKAYYLSYNQYTDVFVITEVSGNRYGEIQSTDGTASIYYNTVAGSNIENVDFTSIGYISTSQTAEFETMDYWLVPPTVYSSGDKFFSYMSYFRYRTGYIISISGFKNGENSWRTDASSNVGVADPILFNGSYFCVSPLFTGSYPTRITFSSGVASPSYTTFPSSGTPPGIASGTGSSNGRARFFIHNGKLIYIVITKTTSTSPYGTVQIYTSTDGITFTLIKSHVLPTLNSNLYNVIYLGETAETWNFIASTRRDTTTQQSNAVFYYINKADYSVENEESIIIDGEPAYFGVTKYE